MLPLQRLLRPQPHMSTELKEETGEEEGSVEEERENLYGNVYEFVGDFLARIYATDISQQRADLRWCSHWFHHAEAVARLEACWKAFEVLRLDPGTGASVWFRDHADPCMTALTRPDGPFRGCSDTAHKTPRPLPVVEPPAYLFGSLHT